MSKEPESIWIDRGPLGGWMFRTERLHDSVRQYVPADRIEALEAENERLREADYRQTQLLDAVDLMFSEPGKYNTRTLAQKVRAALEPKP